MMKIRGFLHEKGFEFGSISGWMYFFKRCKEFTQKYRGHVWKTIREKMRISEEMRRLMIGNKERSYEEVYFKTKMRHTELTKLKWILPNLKKKYHFSIAILVDQRSSDLDDLLIDIEKQIYPVSQVILFEESFREDKKLSIEDSEKINKSKKIAEFDLIHGIEQVVTNMDGDFLLFLREGDRLNREAFFELALELNQQNETALLYTDHDTMYGSRILFPYFKPGWSPDLFLVNNYIKRAFIVSRRCVQNIKIDAEAYSYELFCYDLALKISEIGTVARLPKAIFHLKYDPYEEDYSEERNQVRASALARRKEDAILDENCYMNPMVNWKIHGNPRVSIIIPTCYTKDYIQKCLESIETKTTYKNYEIIVIDNSRKSPRYGQKILKNFRCKILYINEPFNWARLNNLAAEQATGKFLLFLNDDIEIITPEWIEGLLSNAQREDVAMVGPMLLFPQGTVQSAGVFLVNHGGGGRSYFLHENENYQGYHDFLHYQRECSFVIGACIMLEKKKFDQLHGFDENFALVGNEMDLGLRLRQAGYRNIYQPNVQLTHKEKASRANLSEEAGDNYIWKVWGHKLEICDEYFNPNLDNYCNTPTMDENPTVNILVGNPGLSTDNIRKILLVKLDHIGDIIISLAAIRYIRSMFPDACIDVLCGPWGKTLLEAQPEIDHVFIYNFFDVSSGRGVVGNSETAIKKLISEMKLEHYDLSIHLRRHEETKIIAEYSADYCLSFSSDPVGDALSHSVPMLGDFGGKRPKWSMHDQLLMLVRNIGFHPELDRELKIPPAVQQSVQKLIAEIPQFSASLRIGIHAGAGGTFKQWNPQYFARLCNLILYYTNAEIILFGGKDEIPINQKIIESINDTKRVVDIAGKQSLLEYCAMVKHVDYFIGNCSGPKHIAAIQGVPTITINGSTSEQEWASPGIANMSVRKMMSCYPCYFYLKQQCPEHICLNHLGPGTVFEGLKRLMLLYPIKKM